MWRTDVANWQNQADRRLRPSGADPAWRTLRRPWRRRAAGTLVPCGSSAFQHDDGDSLWHAYYTAAITVDSAYRRFICSARSFASPASSRSASPKTIFYSERILKDLGFSKTGMTHSSHVRQASPRQRFDVNRINGYVIFMGVLEILDVPAVGFREIWTSSALTNRRNMCGLLAIFFDEVIADSETIGRRYCPARADDRRAAAIAGIVRYVRRVQAKRDHTGYAAAQFRDVKQMQAAHKPARALNCRRPPLPLQNGELPLLFV